MVTDAELLRRYVDEKTEDAFREFVTRHINLVYSSALRQVGNDAHRANDVTQLVFLTAARKARALLGHPVLPGWLYNTTYHVASRTMRQERARQLREFNATQMHDPSDAAEAAVWKHIEPELDAALQRLSDPERQALVLRFFSGCSYAQVGAGVGVSEDAARMRVDRALDKLRRQFQRRGITSTNAVLSAALAHRAVAAAPSGLASAVTHAVIAAASVGTGTVAALLNLMTSTKALVAGAALACAIAAVGLSASYRPAASPSPAATPTTAPAPGAAARATAANPAAAVRPGSSAATLVSTEKSTAVILTSSPVNASGGNLKQMPPPVAMPLDEMLGPDNLYHDDTWGVSMTYPEGWKIARGIRWGEEHRQNTVFFSAAAAAVSSVYYQRYPDAPPASENAEAFLRNNAQQKERSRIEAGLSDYQNVPASFAYSQINGHPALSYFATFTQGNDVQTEYFIRILGQDGYVMFFTHGRLETVQTLMPSIQKMAASVKLR